MPPVFAVFVLVVCSVASSAVASPSGPLSPLVSQYDEQRTLLDDWAAWKAQHGKRYADVTEEAQRLAVWTANSRLIALHNQSPSSFSVAMNKFGDLTSPEFRARYLRARLSSSRFPAARLGSFAAAGVALPGNWSWVDQGVVTDIKDQGNCGSCWAFSAIAAVEGAYNLANKGKVASQCSYTCGASKTPCCSFSEQEIVDCTLNGADTCNLGGEPHDGILWIVSNKGNLNTEAQYPYTSGNSGTSSSCQPQSDPVQTGIRGYVNVTHGDEQALTEATYQFPVISVGIDASDPLFQFYSGGIYYSKSCKNTPDALDHGVAVVGYGSGSPKPPGPPPPPPGPSNCDTNYYKPECLAEKGCFWCVDAHNFGYCMNEPCPTMSVANGNGEYYMVKNSWGKDWGLNGYVAMSRNRDNNCGIATDAVYAVMSQSE